MSRRFASALLTLLSAPLVYAELTFDGTVGNTASQAPQTGAMSITQAMGQVNGQNLFHSFSTFNVNTGESAAFSANTSIRNIIARVTGLEPSTIDGSLTADASLWLLNPQGILVGANATVNVPGTFALGAADFLQLEDGSLFNMTTAVNGSTLLVSPPADFGFVANSAAGSVAMTGFTFDQEQDGGFVDGAEIVIAGGSVTLNQTHLTTYSDAQAAGELRIVAGTGDVTLTSSSLVAQTRESNQDISSQNSAGPIDVRAPNGVMRLNGGSVKSDNFAQEGAAGRVRIVGGAIVATNATITSHGGGGSFSQARSADVEIAATTTLALTNSTIESTSFSEGGGGNIFVHGADVTLQSTGVQSVQGQADWDVGDTGDITLEGTNSLTLLTAGRLIRSDRTDSGASGDIRLRGGAITLHGDIISRNSFGGSQIPVADLAKNGDVSIEGASFDATESSIQTITTYRPAAGDVSIDVTGRIRLEDTRVQSIAFGGDPTSLGAAGSITLRAGSIELLQSSLQNSTQSDGLLQYEETDDGSFEPIFPEVIVPVAVPAMRVEATGDIHLESANLDSSTSGATDAGSITVHGANVSITDLGDQSFITSSSSAEGRAGSITIEGTSSITSNVDGSGAPILIGLAAPTVVSSSGQRPGSITFRSPGIDLSNIRFDTTTSGATVAAFVPGQVQLDATGGFMELAFTDLRSLTFGANAAGNITLRGDRVSLADTAISSFNLDAFLPAAQLGQAGAVRIEGGDIDLNRTDISATTMSSRAGNAPATIVMDAGNDALVLTGNTTITSTTTGANDAGNISLGGRTIEIGGSTFLNASTVARGDAGNIAAIATERFTLHQQAQIISESSDFNPLTGFVPRAILGSAGSITIRAPDVDLSTTTIRIQTVSSRTDTTPGALLIEGTHSLLLDHAPLELSTLDAADAGNLTLRGGAIEIDQASVVATAASSGDAGSITIEGDSLHATRGVMTTSTTAAGNAGNIVIRGNGASAMSGPVTLDEGIQLRSTSTGSGNAGDVSIVSVDSIRLLDSAQLFTSSLSSGAAGSVALAGASLVGRSAQIFATTASPDPTDAPTNVDLLFSGDIDLEDTTISSQTLGAARAGNITIDAGSFRSVGGLVLASTSGPGAAGDITVTTTGGTTLNTTDVVTRTASAGAAGTITFAGPAFALTGGSLAASTTGTGDAGSIRLVGVVHPDDSIEAMAGNVAIGGDVESTTRAAGDAGSVLIATHGEFTIENGTIRTLSELGGGNAGSIDLSSGALSMTSGEISATATTAGAAATAGNITIEADTLSMQGSVIAASTAGTGNAGTIVLRGVTQGGIVAPLSGVEMHGSDIASVTTGSGSAGSISLQNDATLTLEDSSIRTSSEGGSGNAGSIGLTGSTVTITRSDITATTGSDDTGVAAPDVGIAASESLTIASSVVSASSQGAAPAGSIFLDTEANLAIDASTLSVSTLTTGDAGRIDLFAVNASIVDSDIASTTAGAGDAGAISAQIDGAVALDGATIRTLSTGDGRAGSIQLFAATLDATDAEISATTSSNDVSVTPADITIATSGIVRLDDSTIAVSTSGAASAGTIVIDAFDGIEFDGSTLTASTTAGGNAGSVGISGRTIALSATDIASTTSASGHAGSIELTAQDSFAIDHGSIRTESTGTGNAGSVRLVGRSLTAHDAEIAATTASNDVAATPTDVVLAFVAGDVDLTRTTIAASTSGAASAGNVVIFGAQTLLDHTTVTASTTAAGNAGNVVLNANPLSIVDSDIASTTAGVGHAGSVSFQSDGTTRIERSSVRTASTGTGDAGNITIEADTLSMQGSVIAASTAGTGNAGTIVLRGVTQGGIVAPLSGVEIHGSDIASVTTGSGSAGSISLQNDATLTLDDSSIRTSSEGGSGNAGSIGLTGSTVTITRSDITATTGSDDTGVAAPDVGIAASESLTIASSVVSASSQGAAHAGSIFLDTEANLAIDASTLSVSTLTTGDAGRIDLFAVNASIVDSDIASTTAGAGDAGAISAQIDGAVALDGATIRTLSTGDGRAGSIQLFAATLDATDAEISATTSSNDVSVTPADITIATSGIVRLDDSTIAVSTSGAASAGTIVIDAFDGIEFDGSTLTASTTAGGNAGSVGISARTITLSATDIASTTSASGHAGSIELTAQESFAIDHGSIRTESTGTGNAGSVRLVGRSLTAHDAEIAATTASNDVAATPTDVVLAFTAGDVDLTRTTIAASTSGAASAGNVVIFGAQTLLDHTTVTASTTATGNAGSVTITADSVTLSDHADVASTSTGSTGNAGAVSIQTTRAITIDASSMRTLSTADGNAGTIALSGSTFDATNAEISATTAGSDPGAAPSDVSLDFDGAVTLAASTISSSTSGAASAGGVDIDATSFTQSGGSVEASTSGAGNAGNLRVHTTGDVHLTNGATIQTTASSTGAAGSIEIDAQGDVVIDTPAASALARSGSMRIAAAAAPSFTSISSQSLSISADAGRAGSIVINGRAITLDNARIVADAAGGNGSTQRANIDVLAADSIALSNSAQIRADTSGGARGGEILLFTPGDVTLDGAGTRISSSTSGAGAGGNVNVGSIVAPVRSLTLTNGAAISADTTGTGAGGQVNISILNDLVLSGRGTTISSNATGPGNGGIVQIQANNANLDAMARIESTATGLGDSGAIALEIAGDLRLTSDHPQSFSDQTAILTSSNRSSGGDIFANVGGELRLIGSRIESSVTTNAGQGGDVNIATKSLFMQQSQILARADQGNGGAITISRLPGTTGRFLIDSESTINADSAAGVSGSVSIDSPDTDVNSAVTVPDARITNDPTLSADICSRLARGTQSSFVVLNQGGIAPRPDGYFPAGIVAVPTGASAPVTSGADPLAVPVRANDVALASSLGGCP